MRNLILAALVLGNLSVAAWAQAPKDSWENLQRLPPGHKIKIVDKQLKSWDGKLVSVSEESIIVREKSKQQEITVARANVLRVADAQRSKRGRNALIGFAAGAAIGVIAGAGRERETGEHPALIGAGLFGLAGAAVGTLVPPTHPTLYRASPPNPNP